MDIPTILPVSRGGDGDPLDVLILGENKTRKDSQSKTLVMND